MPKTKIIDEAYKEAIKLLGNLGTPAGFTASLEDTANYYRVWSRDGVIAGLAALSSDSPKLIKTFHKTLITLKNNQDKTGRLPSNVPIKNKGKVSYGTIVGRVDATIWYIIGACDYYLKTKDEKFLKEFTPSIEKALFYLECLEMNGRGLLYIPQGGDWADEYINHGYILFDQILYWLALDRYSQITKNKKLKKKSNHLKNLILINFFPKRKNLNSKYVYHKWLFLVSLKQNKYALPIVTYFTSHSARYHIDNFANSLLFLSGITDKNTNQKIRKVVLKKCRNKNFPILPAFHPVITKSDERWGNLSRNFVYKFRNQPYEYHNGGRWPLVHGFFIASMNKTQGRKELNKFAKVLRGGDFDFSEYYNGQNFTTGGTKWLGFSASAYVLAYNSLIKNKKVI